jgi:D-erythro-7,8-dihydroneopterin triphosphate epimerase
VAIIRINDLTVRTIVGTQPYERKNRQDVIINVALEYDAGKAAKSDSISDALDYYKLSQKIIGVVRRSRDQLLEKLAVRVLKLVMEDKRVDRGWVQLAKPQAVAEAKTICYELSAEKGEKL